MKPGLNTSLNGEFKTATGFDQQSFFVAGRLTDLLCPPELSAAVASLDPHRVPSGRAGQSSKSRRGITLGRRASKVFCWARAGRTRKKQCLPRTLLLAYVGAASRLNFWFLFFPYDGRERRILVQWNDLLSRPQGPSESLSIFSRPFYSAVFWGKSDRYFAMSCPSVAGFVTHQPYPRNFSSLGKGNKAGK